MMVVGAIRSPGCPYGWRQFGQSCYMIDTDTPLNWYEARQVCLDAGSDLALPNSEAEQDFVWNMEKEQLTDIHFPNNVWLGCKYGMEASGKLEFVDNNQNNYNKINTNVTGCCVLQINGGRWALINCSKERRVMCERTRCTTSLRCFAVTTMDSEHHDQPYCLLGHTFKETIIKSPIQCCLACYKDPNCRSFNLSGKMCQLNNATISQVDADKYLNRRENCTYYEYE